MEYMDYLAESAMLQGVGVKVEVRVGDPRVPQAVNKTLKKDVARS